MIRLNRRWLGGLMFAVVFPSPAPAQTVTRSFDELQQVLKLGETILITDESGRQTKGKVAGVSGASLTVLAPEQQIFPARSVAQIRRTDSLWNGALIGAGVGVAVYVGGLMNCSANQWNCNNARGAEQWIPGSPMTAWLAPAVGALVGALRDRAKGNEPIYVAASRQPAVAVSPWTGRKATGISVSLRF